MEYLAGVGGRRKQPKGSGGSHRSIESQVLESNPVLEAFGNAKTVRNNNSSRFGKFIEIQFDKDGRVSGAAIRSYLLERSRVVQIADPERNYHCFYQLCDGATPEEVERYRLPKDVAARAQHFHYLNQSKCFELKGKTNNADEYVQTKRAMNVIGITPEDQDSIFGVVAAVLHLGNLSFKEEGDGLVLASQAAVTHLDAVTDILQVDREALLSSLTTMTRKVGREVIRSSLQLKPAAARRDALAKTLYSKMFDWIVDKINRSIGQDSKSELLIGVLDIYGFEHFKKNSFEQFCINLANEKLQQHFNQHVLKLEQEEYEKEGIDWSKIEFRDNQEVLTLIEGEKGILYELDSACKLAQTTVEAFTSTLHANFKKHERFSKGRGSVTDFSIKHYAGKVKYSTEEFIVKNLDVVVQEHEDLLRASNNGFVRGLFAGGDEEGGGAEEKKPGKAAAKFSSIGRKFKRQLASLMDTLNATEPHYIRCVKPNSKSKPGIFSKSMVMDQLRSGGVLEAIRMCSQGFPTRRPFGDFIDRFALLNPSILSSELSDVEMVRRLLEATGLENYQVGHTKVFLKAGHMLHLDTLRTNKMNAAAATIQRCYRAFVFRLTRKRAAVTIQRCYRGYRARKAYKRLREERAAARIQAWERRRQAMLQLRRLRSAAVCVAKHWRGFRARRVLSRKRQEKAARTIQRWWRGYHSRKPHLLLRRYVRTRQARLLLKQLKQDAAVRRQSGDATQLPPAPSVSISDIKMAAVLKTKEKAERGRKSMEQQLRELREELEKQSKALAEKTREAAWMKTKYEEEKVQREAAEAELTVVLRQMEEERRGRSGSLFPQGSLDLSLLKRDGLGDRALALRSAGEGNVLVREGTGEPRQRRSVTFDLKDQDGTGSNSGSSSSSREGGGSKPRGPSLVGPGRRSARFGPAGVAAAAAAPTSSPVPTGGGREGGSSGSSSDAAAGDLKSKLMRARSIISLEAGRPQASHGSSDNLLGLGSGSPGGAAAAADAVRMRDEFAVLLWACREAQADAAAAEARAAAAEEREGRVEMENGLLKARVKELEKMVAVLQEGFDSKSKDLRGLTAMLISKSREEGGDKRAPEPAANTIMYISGAKQQEFLLAAIEHDLGFMPSGLPVAACAVFKALTVWGTFKLEKTNTYDRVVEALQRATRTSHGRGGGESSSDLVGIAEQERGEGGAEEGQAGGPLAYWLSNHIVLYFLVHQEFSEAEAAAVPASAPTASSGWLSFGAVAPAHKTSNATSVGLHLDAMLFQQQLAMGVERLFVTIRDNAKAEIERIIVGASGGGGQGAVRATAASATAEEEGGGAAEAALAAAPAAGGRSLLSSTKSGSMSAAADAAAAAIAAVDAAEAAGSAAAGRRAAQPAKRPMMRSLKRLPSLVLRKQVLSCWAGFTVVLGDVVRTLKSMHVPLLYVDMLLRQLLAFINSKMFNSLMVRSQWCPCTYSNGEILEEGVARVDRWVHSVEVSLREELSGAPIAYGGSSNGSGSSGGADDVGGSAGLRQPLRNELKHVRQAILFLTCDHKPKRSLEELAAMCPDLSPNQLVHLCMWYTDDKYGTKGVSSEVVQQLWRRVEEDSPMLLAEEQGVPFMVDQTVLSMPPIDIHNIELPECLKSDPAFSFLFTEPDGRSGDSPSSPAEGATQARTDGRGWAVLPGSASTRAGAGAEHGSNEGVVSPLPTSASEAAASSWSLWRAFSRT